MDLFSLVVLWLLSRGGAATAPAGASPRPQAPRPQAPRPQAPVTAPPRPSAPSPEPFPFPRDDVVQRPLTPAAYNPSDTSFPGPNWVPDNPVPPDVVARASALLPVLWARGEGAGVVELIGGRKIGFLATSMGEGKRGVTAWRPRTAPAGAAPASYSPPAASRPAMSVPQPKPQPQPKPVAVTPVSDLTDEEIEESAPALTYPTLRKGMRGPEVTRLQRAFGWQSVTDFFGDQTEAKVKEIQRSNSLPVTGVADQALWETLLRSA